MPLTITQFYFPKRGPRELVAHKTSICFGAIKEFPLEEIDQERHHFSRMKEESSCDAASAEPAGNRWRGAGPPRAAFARETIAILKAKVRALSPGPV